MNDVLIVTGTAGVGKSTICWQWAGRRQGATIHCDSFRTWIRNKALRRANGYQEELLAKHAASLAEDYLAMGLDVAIDNVWTPEGLSYLMDRLGSRGNIRVFWLNCEPNENHRRDESRSPSDVMAGRLDEVQAELEQMNWPDCLIRIDTTGQSIGETIDTLERNFQQQVGDDA